MIRRYFLAAFGVFAAAASARADIPLPSHLTYVKPQLAFEGIAEHADYVFCLRYLTFVGGPSGTPHTVIQVRDSKPFTLDCQRRLIDMQLLAIKKSDFENRSKDEKSLTWLTDKTEGVLAAEVDAPSTVAKKAAKTPPLSTYRVKLKEGKLAVESVSQPDDQESNSRGVLPNSIAGIALAVGLASLGLLLVRRRSTGRLQSDA
jgi:hypothetical protein